MKGKVGLAIVTYGTNYGTYLQAFATQNVIRKLGYETEIINIDSVRREVSSARKIYFAKQLFNFPELKSYKNVIKGILAERISGRYRAYMLDRKKQFSEFSRQFFFFSEVKDSWRGLTELCLQQYEHVLVGSDQLWRPANIAGNFYTLHFVPEQINKISYATSFGLKNVRAKQEKQTRDFLSRIEHLSVRENSGASIVRQLTGRNIPVVCDPTLLMNRDEWSEFIADEPILSAPYIFCYFLGENKKHRDFVIRLAAETGYKIVSLSHIAGYNSADKHFADIYPTGVGPFEFLNYIKNAKYVCTDSFHGCVFASLFGRRLFAFRRFSKNSTMSTNDRITTLLSSLHMENSLIQGTEKVADVLGEDISFRAVEEKITIMRTMSMQYLNKAFDREPTDC